MRSFLNVTTQARSLKTGANDPTNVNKMTSSSGIFKLAPSEYAPSPEYGFWDPNPLSQSVRGGVCTLHEPESAWVSVRLRTRPSTWAPPPLMTSQRHIGVVSTKVASWEQQDEEGVLPDEFPKPKLMQGDNDVMAEAQFDNWALALPQNNTVTTTTAKVILIFTATILWVSLGWLWNDVAVAVLCRNCVATVK